MPPTPPINITHPLTFALDFQPTTASKALLAWWRQGSGGCCCLVGLGGGGKTATIDHFVRSLGLMPRVPSTSIAEKVPDPMRIRPRAALVFSLAQGSLDAFFGELYAWLRGDSPAASTETYDAVRRELAAAGQ